MNTWHGRRMPPGWDRTRRRILRRDQGICCICGKPGADQVDHIIPVTQGGAEDDSNYAAIHSRPCHLAKSLTENAIGRTAPRKRPPEKHPGDLT